MSLEPAVGLGSKNPLLRYILIPLASYAENFKVLGPKLWEEFPYLCRNGPVKYKSIDIIEKLSKVEKLGCFSNLTVNYCNNDLRLILDKGGVSPC